MSAGWEAALDRLLGDPGWRTVFYATVRQTTLFGDVTSQLKMADLTTIEKYVRARLSSTFRGAVAKNTLQLRNSKGSCMFLLFFACGNPSPKAHQLALKFARHVLQDR